MALNDSAELLALIRLRGSIPSNNVDWTAALVLAQATRELLETHLPLLIAARGEYLVKTTDIPLVAGQLAYRLPARCCAVRQVDYLQADGTCTPIVEAKPSDLSNDRTSTTQRGRPTRYNFREHSLEVYPLPPSAGDKLRVRWHMRPSRITPSDTGALAVQITAINRDTPSAGLTKVTCGSAIPSSPFTLVDFVKATSPFDIVAYDCALTSTFPSYGVFASALIPDELAVGDWFCAANYSPFANCPVELHQPIALRTAAAIIAPKGDSLAAALVGEAGAKEAQLLKGVLAPRSKGNPQVLKSRRWG